MGYLKSKKGTLEDAVNKISKYATESDYQKMFKKELEKAGKGIGSMSDQEKKDFFNKIDKKYKGKNEETGNKTLTGSQKSKVDLKPKIDYNKYDVSNLDNKF